MAALMAAMLVVMSAPAMANDLFGGFNDSGDFLANDIGGFDGFRHHDRFGDEDELDEDELDTIRVGDLECLVEEHEDVLFCVDDDGNIVNRF